MAGSELRARMYGPQDLSSLPLFAGGFINFGYWRGIPLDGELSVEQRISSQQQLYRLVLRALDVSSGSAPRGRVRARARVRTGSRGVRRE